VFSVGFAVSLLLVVPWSASAQNGNGNGNGGGEGKCVDCIADMYCGFHACWPWDRCGEVSKGGFKGCRDGGVPGINDWCSIIPYAPCGGDEETLFSRFGFANPPPLRFTRLSLTHLLEPCHGFQPPGASANGPRIPLRSRPRSALVATTGSTRNDQPVSTART
jgi:hypothetical protein